MAWTKGRSVDVQFGLRHSPQFLAARKELLAAFDAAKDIASRHMVPTYHGVFIEPAIRKWLRTFLPNKYGVCAGYIIPDKITDSEKIPHYDLIIYDAMESPILWSETIDDQEHSLAIPASFVRCMYEVKSSFTLTTAKQAVNKLNSLEPLLHTGRDNRYKSTLPDNFFCGVIFVQASTLKNPFGPYDFMCKESILFNQMSESLIIRDKSSGSAKNSTRIEFLQTKAPYSTGIGTYPDGTRQIIYAVQEDNNGWHRSCMTHPDPGSMLRFQYDLLARLNGTYRHGQISNLYGIENDPKAAPFEKPTS